MQATTGSISVRRLDAVLELAIDRPDKKNALTSSMYADLAAALASADTDDTVRAIVITGAGNVFTAGNDIKDFASNPPRGDDTPVARFLRELATAQKPLVAAVPGLAIGVGVTMLLHCDLVVAAESATFKTPFADLGLTPEAASTLLMPRAIGHQRASELFLLGEAFDAKRAYELGLVNRVEASPDEARQTAHELAARIAAKPPEAIRQTKALLRKPDHGVLARLEDEGAIFSQRLVSDEARRAFMSFLAPKR